jgi:hypothetical protein
MQRAKIAAPKPRCRQSIYYTSRDLLPVNKTVGGNHMAAPGRASTQERAYLISEFG